MDMEGRGIGLREERLDGCGCGVRVLGGGRAVVGVRGVDVERCGVSMVVVDDGMVEGIDGTEEGRYIHGAWEWLNRGGCDDVSNGQRFCVGKCKGDNEVARVWQKGR